MSTTAVALIAILAPAAAGLAAWVVRLARQVTMLEAKADAPPAALDKIETKLTEIKGILEAWEKYRWTANEKALGEMVDAIRELIKALAQLGV